MCAWQVLSQAGGLSDAGDVELALLALAQELPIAMRDLLSGAGAQHHCT